MLLVSCETVSASSRSALSAYSVCRKLRPLLETLMGRTGYLALLTRALARATNKVPELRGMKINFAGDLEPLPENIPISRPVHNEESNVVLITELLSLLLSFIGTSLTLQLVREIWPQLPIYESNFEPGER